MLSHRNKYIFYLVLLNGLLTTLLIVEGKSFFEYSQPIFGMAFTLAIFFLYELFVIFFTENKSKTINSRQMVNLFLGYKVGKIILSLLFIAIYATTVKVELKRFIVVFLLLYLIYLLFDTLYLINREKSLKTKHNNI